MQENENLIQKLEMEDGFTIEQLEERIEFTAAVEAEAADAGCSVVIKCGIGIPL